MSESDQICFWLKFLKVFRDLLPLLFACFLDVERLFVAISVSCSFTIWRFLFRFVFSFKPFDYPSEVHLNLVSGSLQAFSGVVWSFKFSDEVSSEGWTGDSSKGTTDQEPGSHSVSQNQSRTLSPAQSLNPSQNLPPKEFPRSFPPTAQKIFAGIHRKGESLQKDQVVQDFDSVEEYHSAQWKTCQNLLEWV